MKSFLSLATALTILFSFQAAQAAGPTYVRDNITVPTVWSAVNSPYVIQNDIVVAKGAILTIEPGVEVRFGSGRTLTISTSTLAGGLVAVGTPADPIVFTSSLASPTPGSWRGIVIERNVLAGSALSHAVIEYAGISPALRLQTVGGSAMTLADLEIRECNREGVSLVGGDPILDRITVACPAATKQGVSATLSSAFTLRDSSISNGLLANESASSGGVSGTTFTSYDTGLPLKLQANRVGSVIPGNVLEGATSSSLVDVTGGFVSESATWPALTYRITGTLLVYSPSAPMLTLEGGATLRFNASGWLTVSASATSQGGLTAVGSPTSPVLFTSNLAVPAPGSWSGIWLGPGVLPESALQHVVVEYTGTGAALNLAQVASSVTLEDGVIRECNGEGIAINNGDPVLSGWEIDCSAGSDFGITTLASPNLTLTGSTVRNGIEIKDAANQISVSGNTFVDYDGGRALKLNPRHVAPVLGSNVLEGATSGSMVDVMGGVITEDATWPPLLYRIVSTIQVYSPSNPMWTIHPGATLRFNAGSILVSKNADADRGGSLRRVRPRSRSPSRPIDRARPQGTGTVSRSAMASCRRVGSSTSSSSTPGRIPPSPWCTRQRSSLSGKGPSETVRVRGFT